MTKKVNKCINKYHICACMYIYINIKDMYYVSKYISIHVFYIYICIRIHHIFWIYTFFLNMHMYSHTICNCIFWNCAWTYLFSDIKLYRYFNNCIYIYRIYWNIVIYIYMFTNLHVCIYVYIYIYILFLHMYIYSYVIICVCICIAVASIDRPRRFPQTHSPKTNSASKMWRMFPVNKISVNLGDAQEAFLSMFISCWMHMTEV